MKYLLKFVIDRWSYPNERYPNEGRYYLTIKVTNNEGQLEKNGILKVSIDVRHDVWPGYYTQYFFCIPCKDYEIVEGKVEIPEVYHLHEQKYDGYKIIELRTEQSVAKFMGIKKRP